MRLIEAVVLVLIATIGVCYSSKSSCFRRRSRAFPRWRAGSSRPTCRPSSESKDLVYLAIGIIGATVMPHNLYLHSALVQTRKLTRDDASVRRAVRYNTIDTVGRADRSRSS